ncbi:type IV secretion system DNA-binding domain-containing protein [Aeoliella sp. SH292]|uniref:type IV secretory system conjugative DNA transfer family protein n=1 Tax=Aeoliella sp. SH292 TaxID=3454464 RepID=UPI003F985009
MNNPSSQDSNLSTSSQSDEVEVRKEQRALALLPKSYSFELTDTFREAFASEKSAVALPSSHRVAMWRKYIGDDAQVHENRMVEEYNLRLGAEYELAVRNVQKNNRKLQKLNEDALCKYQERVTEFNAAHAAWEQEMELEQERLDLQLHEHYRNKSILALHQQREMVNLAVDNIAKVALWERKVSRAMKASRWLLIFSVACLFTGTYPGIWMSGVLSSLSFWTRRRANREGRDTLVQQLNHYEYFSSPYRDRRRARKAGVDGHVIFHICEPDATYKCPNLCITSRDLYVHTPLHVAGKYEWDDRIPGRHVQERAPLGHYTTDEFDDPETRKVPVGLYLVFGVPLFGALLNTLHSRFDDALIARKASMLKLSIYDHRWKKHNPPPESLNTFLSWWENVCDHTSVARRMAALPEPKPPAEPLRHPLMAMPPLPQFKTPREIMPPDSCFDTTEMGDIEHVFKGSQVYGIEQVTTLARAHLFAGDKVRPHFQFGGVPFATTGNSPHMLVVGTTGSGKTTTLLRLMSSLLPLSNAQATRLAEHLSSGTAPYPESSHQWSRSQMHQAVVYNAKSEYLKYLEAFGFDSDVDLFNLDPADPNGYAWDVAADINDYESIQKFSEQLIPKSTAASQDKNQEFWNGTARTVLEAIIVSFRNAARHAGEEPSWTLRDLVTAVASDDSIKHILRWHDTPVQKLHECFGLADTQTSSVMMTLRNCLSEFRLVANRWYDARNRGRAISLKKWCLEGGHSVLVLPNTLELVASYAPLNKALVKALTGLWLDDTYSIYIDENGKRQKRHRHLFIDEFGQAGQFDELERLMAEGRSYGVNVVLGLQQLSQVRKAYGEDGSETIIGLCSYLACLKSNDTRTRKWMSEHIGNCLRSYEKATFTYSTSKGITNTTSENRTDGQSEGSSRSLNASSSKGTSDTVGSSVSNSIANQQSTTSASRPGERGSVTTGTTVTHGLADNSSHSNNESTSEGTTTGSSHQRNTSTSKGTSEAVNNTTNQGTSTTTELRGEPAVEADEFGNFPDPETTGKCEGIYLTPTLPVFRTTLRMAQMQPEFEFPEKLDRPKVRRNDEQDQAVSRSIEWGPEDLQRLFLDKPHTLPEIRHMLILPAASPVEKERTSRVADQQLIQHQAAPDDYGTPLADFDF